MVGYNRTRILQGDFECLISYQGKGLKDNVELRAYLRFQSFLIQDRCGALFGM
jgi:hypothetical protein